LHKFSEPPKIKGVEGFSQEAPFVLKTDLAVYDQFYAEVYDGITDREQTCQKELYEIVKMTDPDTRNSTILDVGSGTGCMVAELADAGYNAYGIDKSSAMIDIAEAKYPNSTFITGDVADAMAFENGLFTHILCTNFTIYEIPDKHTFFRNCYHWLKPNGYLVVHLADKEKFSARTFKDSIMNISALYRSIQPPSKERKTSTTAEFIDYIYNAEYVFRQDAVVLKETFTDKETKHIRQNENTLQMDEIEDVLRIANSAGFILQGKTSMKSCGGDENQYLYVLERSM
jgi:ubiquinone/menaquinone biosynthesis C-methylase UbiE